MKEKAKKSGKKTDRVADLSVERNRKNKQLFIERAIRNSSIDFVRGSFVLQFLIAIILQISRVHLQLHMNVMVAVFYSLDLTFFPLSLFLSFFLSFLYTLIKICFSFFSLRIYAIISAHLFRFDVTTSTTSTTSSINSELLLQTIFSIR